MLSLILWRRTHAVPAAADHRGGAQLLVGGAHRGRSSRTSCSRRVARLAGRRRRAGSMRSCELAVVGPISLASYLLYSRLMRIPELSQSIRLAPFGDPPRVTRVTTDEVGGGRRAGTDATAERHGCSPTRPAGRRRRHGTGSWPRRPTGSYPAARRAWAEANAAKGWSARRIVVDAPDGPVGAQVLLHRMRPGPFQRGYATRGPGRGDARPAGPRGVHRRAPAGRCGPAPVATWSSTRSSSPGRCRQWLRELGWRPIPAIQIDRTRLIDLTRAEEELWSDLRSSARWSVNKARRTGHTVEDAGAAGLDAFGELYLETARRVGFEANAAFRETFARVRPPRARPAAAGARRGWTGRGDPDAARLRRPGHRALRRLEHARAPRHAPTTSSSGSRSARRASGAWRAMTCGARTRRAWPTFKASFGGYERQYIGAWELVTNRHRARRLRGHRAPARSWRRSTAVGAPAAADEAGAAGSCDDRRPRHPTAGMPGPWTRPAGT